MGTNLNTATSNVTPILWLREFEPAPTGTGDIFLAMSATCLGSPPTTTNIFRHGCLITQLDSGTGTSALFENTGTHLAVVWTLVSTGLSGSITRANLSTPAGSKIQETGIGTAGTIATTSNSDGYVIVGETGTLSSVDYSGTDALAASNTNYITFSITNLGQAGAGSTAMLAATATNTTQVTGGTAIAANTKRSLTLNGTPANLAVTQGDRLLVRAAATGTLANTVTFSKVCLRFAGTT